MLPGDTETCQILGRSSAQTIWQSSISVLAEKSKIIALYAKWFSPPTRILWFATWTLIARVDSAESKAAKRVKDAATVDELSKLAPRAWARFGVLVLDAAVADPQKVAQLPTPTQPNLVLVAVKVRVKPQAPSWMFTLNIEHQSSSQVRQRKRIYPSFICVCWWC